jgi:hypothetical protein
MAGDLIIPRCEVYWGDVNLTSYKDSANWPGVDGPQPLVYDVRVSIQESSQTPSGSMKWNPSGRAFSVYENLIKTNYDKTITVRYYYLTGKSITFAFVWAGQVENYGNDMSIEVKLASELDGLVLSSIRSVSQADDAGISMKSAISELEKLYGVDGMNLLGYYPGVEKDLEKVKVKSNYSEGSTFAAALENIGEQNGNLSFLHNLVQTGGSGTGTGIVLFPPYSWEAAANKATIQFPETTMQNPNPALRYGYFLGPAIINTITKTSEWAPPQKTQTYTLNTRQKVQTEEAPRGNMPNPTRTQDEDNSTRKNQKKEGGASGTTGSASRPGMRLEKNEDGEKKKLMLQEERLSKLSTSMPMCPMFTGIKPHDILFIPNFSGTYIEDWIVTAVEYEQSNGGVNVNIQEANGKVASEVVKDVLIGEKATLENWVEYGWGMV